MASAKLAATRARVIAVSPTIRPSAVSATMVCNTDESGGNRRLSASWPAISHATTSATSDSSR